jgi:signal transduction histidine kinase
VERAHVLSRLKIAVRINLLLVLTALGILVSAAIGLWGLSEQMMEDRRIHLRNLMEVVLDDARSDMASAGGPETETGRRAFFEMLRRAKFHDDAPNNYFFSLDYNGLVTSHPNPELQGTARQLFYNGVNITQQFIDIARSPSGSGYLEYGIPKGVGGKMTPKLAFIRNVAELNGLVGVGVFIDDLNSTFFKRFLMEAGLFAMTMPLISFFGYIITRSITAPLSGILRSIRRLAKGDLATPPGRPNEKSELGEVSQALDVLRANAIEQRALQEKVREQTKLLMEQNQLLTEQKVRAEEASKAKSEFLSNMSHELRTPMHAILGYSNLCLDKVSDGDFERMRKFVQNIKLSGKRLLTLLNDLLDLAKMEAGKIDYEREPGDMNDAVRHALMELDPLIKGKDIKLRLSLEARCEAVFDQRHMIQVLINLLSNAIKFSAPGSPIAIELCEEHTAENAPGLRCRIIDEGPGIPEAELEAVFDKFIQSSKTKTGAGGTGLGLAICRSIIAAHGGRIWAENGKPNGAVFTFVIPKGMVGQLQAA